MKRELKGEKSITSPGCAAIYRKAHPDEKGTESLRRTRL